MEANFEADLKEAARNRELTIRNSDPKKMEID